MQLRKTILASVLSAALALSAAACGTAENTQSVRSAAASEHVAETPTPSPEATATASPTDGKIHRISRTGKQRGKRKRRDYCGD